MEDITNNQDDNLGGVELIRFAPVEFFASVFTATFKAGFGWINVYCTKETGQLNERQADDTGGGTYDVAINGSLPKIRPEVHAALSKYSRRPVVVESQDNNGVLRRSGVSGRVTMLYQAGTGTDVSDLNGYVIQFSGKQLSPSLFV